MISMYTEGLVQNMTETEEIPRTLLAYWIDLVFDEMHTNPTPGLLNLYKSLNGVYLKKIKKDHDDRGGNKVGN